MTAHPGAERHANPPERICDFVARIVDSLRAGGQMPARAARVCDFVARIVDSLRLGKSARPRPRSRSPMTPLGGSRGGGPRRKRFGSAFAGLALAVVAGVAAPRSAAAAGPSARLTYVRSLDAASCPDEAELRKAVAARFGYDPFFPWAKKTVVVHIGRDGGRFSARVELVDEGGVARGTRDLHANEGDCSQIFEATALAISIALDAFAAPPADSTPAAPPAPPGKDLPTQTQQAQANADSTPAALPAPPAAPAEIPLPSGEAAIPPPWPPPASPESPPPAPRERAGERFFVGADVLGSAYSAPGAAAGLGVFVAAASRGTSIELRLHADTSAPVSVGSAGRVQTAHFVATFAPCARLGVTFACAIGELGWLRAWSSDLDTVASQAMLFGAAGARIGVQWPVSRALSFRIYAEGAFNLDRAVFEVDYSAVWTAPVAQATLAIGLARRIP